MADIIYTYKNEVYANITNKCDCACTFCIRSQKGAIGDATSLWHTVDPTYDEIIAAIDAFDFTGYEEFVFCGYGEQTDGKDDAHHLDGCHDGHGDERHHRGIRGTED